MTMKRVVVFGMHEPELSAAQHLVKNGTTAGWMVIGELDDGDIDKARQDGLIVQVQPQPPERPKPAVSKAWASTTATRGLGFMARDVEDLVAEADETPAEIDYYALDLAGPLIDQTRSALETAGATIIAALPGGGYQVRAKSSDVAEIQAVSGVLSLRWMTPESSAVETVTQAAPAPAVGQKAIAMLTYDVRLRDPNDRPAVESWLKENRVDIAGSSGRKIRFYVTEDSPILGDLSRKPEVDLVSEYVEPQLYNDATRRIVGIDLVGGAGNPVSYLDGTDEIIAIADTGIDDAHPDFTGRIVGKVARGRAGVTDDPHGHGTHVAGSALGDGSASGGLLKGAAPKAKLFFQSLIDASGKLSGLPLDLNDLFLEAYNAGARIHNNSWGSQAGSAYMINSEEVDDFVHSHPDMVIVIAAGNEGNALAGLPKRGGKGWVDWLSICAPASSKNAITVGASRTDRTDGPNAHNTWGGLWPNLFPDPPIANELVSGDPQSLAAFSSRGPCNDYRIKPDVVAPGTDIASAKSSAAPMTNFFGPYPTTPPANPHYAYDGGTSMAAPFVAGCAALVRQYYRERSHQPSAALVKATLVNGTVWLTGADSNAMTVGVPNYHQGHGRVDMTRAVPNASNSKLVSFFHDDWNAPTLASTGDVVRYQVTVPANCSELRICLAYTDLPARALQNNLNVTAQQGGNPKKYLGNEALPDALTMPDVNNNLETIRIPNPGAGVYYIQVIASNLLKGPQSFALVIAGDDLTGFAPY